MSWLKFLKRTQWDQERLAEIETYLAMEADDNMARGMSKDEAYAAARRKFGNTSLIREEIYRMNSIHWLEEISRDLKYSGRLLRRSPLFTAVALLTLAIGIGANTSVFAVLNSILLRPLPFPHPDRLVAIRQLAPGAPGLADLSDGLLLSPSMYFTYADHNQVFESMGAWGINTATATSSGTAPEQVRVAVVTDGVLQSLAVPAAAGRWLNSTDQAPGNPATVMLGYGYWSRHFGAQRSAIGQTIHLDGKSGQVVGVMPRGFRLVDTDFDFIVPAAFNRRTLKLSGFGYNGVARLKPGVTIVQANANLAPLVNTWMDSWTNGANSNPHYYEVWRIKPDLRSLQRQVVGATGNMLWIVMATVGMVMLLACANVTNLMLVRAESRQQDLAIRSALGAGWRRILREMLLESLLLGALAGTLGLGLAAAALELLKAIGPQNLPRLSEISLDANAFAFAFILCLGSSFLLALFPALKYARPHIANALRAGGRNTSASLERHRLRNTLATIQIAIALVLLVSAGLMIRTLLALKHTPLGVNTAALQTLRTSIPRAAASDALRVTQLERELTNRLAALPGVQSAAFINAMPLQDFGSDWDQMLAEGQPETDNKPAPMRLYKYVSPGFFHTAGLRLLAGRDYNWNEVYALKPELIISAGLARELWGSPAQALGKRMREYASSPWREVIGVVDDVRENGFDKEPPAIVYWPPIMTNLFAEPGPYAKRNITLILRTNRAGSQSLLSEIQQTVWSVEPSLPLASILTMQEICDKSLAQTSFVLVMLALAASVALILGIIGIYGVISYSVSQRTREIGTRIALGASPFEMEKMFLIFGVRLASAGLCSGFIAALFLTRFLRSVVFGVSTLDPATYIATALLLALCAATASLLPARRAARVDPVYALKAD